MPEDNHEHTSSSTLLKWILGIVVAGVSALAGWGGNAISETNARANKSAEDSAAYLKEMIKAERDEVKAERANGTAAVRELTKVVEGQTKVVEGQADFFGKMIERLDTMIKDQRHLPAIREAYAKPEPRPEQP